MSGLEKAHQASQRLQSASEHFQAANDKFTTKFSEIAKQNEQESSCQLTVSIEDFETYKLSIGELIAAAKDFESTASVVSNSARGDYRGAIQNLETCHTAFSTVSDGQTNGEALISLLDAAGEYLKAQTEFMRAFGTAIQRKTKRLGAH